MGVNSWQLECFTIKNRSAHILKTGEYSDCTFLVGEPPHQARIAAHKTILAMSSPIFQIMFDRNISECDPVITIVDVEVEIFKLLLVYIYTDEIILDSDEKVWKLLSAAKRYMLPHLIEKCVTYILSTLCAGNVLKVYEYNAKFIEDECLMNHCVQVIQQYTKQVLRSSCFTEASLETVCTVFSMDPLNIDSELELFAAAERYATVNKLDGMPPEIQQSARKRRLDSPIHTQVVEDESRSEAKFSFTVGNFTELSAQVYSPACYIRNLPWQIVVRNNTTQGRGGVPQRTLGVYVMCNALSKSSCWSCYATFKIVLISHKPGVKPYSAVMEHLFHSKENGMGYAFFITWDNLLDPKYGYVKDDTITLEVHLSAEAPHGVLGTFRNGPDGDPKDKLTIRNAMRLIRFLTLTADQFAEVVAKSKLIDKLDQRAILLNMLAKKRNKKQRVPMPQGFSKSRVQRRKIKKNIPSLLDLVF